jgi:polyhydroxybutyrate depolymerase
MTGPSASWSVIAAAITLSAVTLSGQRPEIMTWNVEGQTRRAIVYPPSYDTGRAAPLVLSFHGYGDNADNFQHTGLHRAWREAIVVYFQGLPRGRGGLFGWQTERGEDDDRDLKLVDAALAGLRGEFKVDDARVYSTGFSNGANFTYLLWAERPSVFAAFAPVAGRLRPSVRPTQPKPILHIGGVRDGQILFSDQQAAIEAAKLVDGADNASSCGDGCTLFSSSAGVPVMTWIHPGGHTYPDETSPRIARFFREHPGPRTRPE